MKRLSLICLVAAAMLCGCKRSDADSKHASEAPQQQAPHIDVARAVTDSLTLYRTYPGTLESNSTVQVVARVSGTLLTKNFKSGAQVTRGQVLYTIDNTTYLDAVHNAEAALASARSEHEYAVRRYEAMQKALLSDAVSRIEVAQSRSNVEETAAAVKQATAALADARKTLSYCTVTAPISGRISSSAVDPGAYLNGGVQPVSLASIYDNSQVLVDFYIEEDAFMRMFASTASRRNLDSVKVPLSFSDSLPHSYVGTMSYVAPTVDTSTGTVHVRCTVNNPYGELSNGMYASVRLPYRTEPRAVLVKDAALSTDQLGKYLYTLNDSNRIVYTPVTVGDVYADTMRVIEKGITPGTRYVTRAMLKVHPGMPVTPVLTK